MKFLPTQLPGVLIVEPDVYRDQRGWFLETYHVQKYQEGGMPLPFVQHNCSSSVRGTLRGLHLQMTRPQGKLLRVIRGEIFDVAVDIRKGSPTFASWMGVALRVRISGKFIFLRILPMDFVCSAMWPRWSTNAPMSMRPAVK